MSMHNIVELHASNICGTMEICSRDGLFEPFRFYHSASLMARGIICVFSILVGVVWRCEGVVYLTSPGCPTDIGLQLGKAYYPCSR